MPNKKIRKYKSKTRVQKIALKQSNAFEYNVPDSNKNEFRSDISWSYLFRQSLESAAEFIASEINALHNQINHQDNSAFASKLSNFQTILERQFYSLLMYYDTINGHKEAC